MRDVPIASEASKQAARNSGLQVRWHALGGELIPFVPLNALDARIAEADCFLRRAYADAHPEDVPIDVLRWLNPEPTKERES